MAMAKIKVSQPDSPYTATLDTDAMDVDIREAFLGVGFTSEDGTKLAVAMRDDGFEVRYTDAQGNEGPWVEFKGQA
jgi:hypothetical protein